MTGDLNPNGDRRWAGKPSLGHAGGAVWPHRVLYEPPAPQLARKRANHTSEGEAPSTLAVSRSPLVLATRPTLRPDPDRVVCGGPCMSAESDVLPVTIYGRSAFAAEQSFMCITPATLLYWRKARFNEASPTAVSFPSVKADAAISASTTHRGNGPLSLIPHRGCPFRTRRQRD